MDNEMGVPTIISIAIEKCGFGSSVQSDETDLVYGLYVAQRPRLVSRNHYPECTWSTS